MLIGGLSAGALTACGPDSTRPVSAQNVYTNNYFIPGVGYYHAPFRAWYPYPYNYFDPRSGNYFYGGQWGLRPLENITNISAPLLDAARLAENQRTDIARGGFGGTSGGHHWGHS